MFALLRASLVPDVTVVRLRHDAGVNSFVSPPVTFLSLPGPVNAPGRRQLEGVAPPPAITKA